MKIIPDRGKTLAYYIENRTEITGNNPMNRKPRFFLWLVFLFSLCVINPIGNTDAADPGGLASKLAPLIDSRDALMICGPDGKTIVAINEDLLLIPASILKLLTSLAAFHYMDDTYRFPTDFYLSPHNDLIIKGYGDPMMISEKVSLIAARLAENLSGFNDLVLDDSYFIQPIKIPGRGRSLEPYDAPNGALCVNFNTVFFKRERGIPVSAEPQTPLLPSTLKKIEASKLETGRITLAANSTEGLQYTGELFQYFFTNEGIEMDGRIRVGRVDPHNDTLLLHYLSDTILTQVVSALLEYSNNFIANQLLLAMGAKVHGPPATLDKGLAALDIFYRTRLGISAGQFVEASGISRQNRISARAMMKILDQFYPFHHLMRKRGRQWYKTGTLNGISTQAGYLECSRGGHYRFVIIINTPGKTTKRMIRLMQEKLQ